MLCDRFSAEEQLLIEDYLNYQAPNPYSEVFRNAVSLKDRLAVWSHAKSEYLYRLLNDNFILERQVEYNESVSVLSQRISRACCYGGKMMPFVNAYRHWIDSLSFDYFSNEYSVLHSLTSSDCLNRESLGQNQYINQYLPINIDFGNGQKIKLDRNTKPMRVLGKIAKMFNLNEEAFEEFRLEHSRILNVKKITGTLCLSIHPLDYMTMSTNSENWTSCMNWVEPGGYRGGTIEVMNSAATLVVYLKSDKNDFSWSYNGKWNSKKWRLLITITPSAIVSIKAYPYHHEELAKEALQWVRELASQNLNWFYGAIQNIPACSTFEYPDTKEWYNIDLREGRMMYCDWGCDTHYGCMTLNPDEIGSSKHDPHALFLEYCGPMTCMCCGRINQGFYDESYVFCENCCSYGEEDGVYCERCGAWIPEGEVRWVGDTCYCDDCIEEIAGICAITGDYFYNEELCQIYLTREAGEPNTSEDYSILVYEDYCTGRWSCHFDKDYVKISNPHMTEDGIYYFNQEDMTERGLRWLYHLNSTEALRYFKETE